MKKLKKLIKFLINDFKTDYLFLKQLFKGEYKLTYQKKQELKQAFDIIGLFRENWIWLLIIILSFCVGWFCASQYYQDLVNKAIINFTNNCVNTIPLNIT